MKKSIKSSDNTRLVYYDYNTEQKETIIFLHGIGGNHSEWNPEIKLLKKKKIRLIIPDLRGNGYSDTPKIEKKFSLNCFAQDLELILTKEEIKNYTLVGHSFGGAVIIYFLVNNQFKDPSGLVFIETTYKYPYKKNREFNINPIILFFLKSFLKLNTIFNGNKPIKRIFRLDKFNKNSLIENIRRYYLVKGKSVVFALHQAELISRRENKIIKNKLSKLKIPTLIVSGLKDHTISPKYSKKLYNLIPHSQLKEFPNASHDLPLTNPGELVETILNFKKEINKKS